MNGSTRATDRRAARSLHSSPYASARPAPKKKSSWTFGIGGLLNYINPLRSRRSAESDDEEEDSDGIEEQETIEINGASSPTDVPMRSPSDYSMPAKPPVLQNPAESLSARGHKLAGSLNRTQQSASQAQINLFSTPPRVASSSSPDNGTLSPSESLEKVKKFLGEKDGQALSEWETRGLLTFLEKSVHKDDDHPEPFRFSSSPSRTPARGNSPAFVFGTPGTSPATNGDGTTPRKTLSKNPNGVYRWQGGGSARPRNRYQSPSFGMRQPPPTIKLSPAKTDTKRRRVGEDVNTSSSQKVPFPAVSPQKPSASFTSTPAPGPTPAPSQTRPNIFPLANGTSTIPSSTASSTPKINGNGPSAPRLRTSGLPTKPTAPSVPSPLRQTWGQSDSPPHSPGSKPNGTHTPTKAANFMTELIKEVTPVKKPDLSNPYQTASPVKPPAKKPVTKKPRASVKPPPPPPQEKASEPSTQAIIEATLPTGSKRSRPPPDLIKSKPAEAVSAPSLAPAPTRRNPPTQSSDLPAMNGSSDSSITAPSTNGSPIVFEITDGDEGDDRAAKKQRTSPKKESTVTVEEIEDVDSLPTSKSAASLFSHPTEIIEPDNVDNLTSNDKPPSPIHGFLPSLPGSPPVKSAFGVKTSAPKEPSKLRFSYQADKTETPSVAPSVAPAFEAPLASTSFAPPPAPKPAAANLPAATATSPKILGNLNPKQTVIAMAVYDLPTFSIPLPMETHRDSRHDSIRDTVKAMSQSLLPTFDFSASVSAPSTSAIHAVSKPTAPPVVAFNWSAAGIQAPAPAGESWTCSSCMLSSPVTADKCTVCEAPRPASGKASVSGPTVLPATGSKPTAAPVMTFDWAAAGMKVPSIAGANWTCSTCMLSNPTTADKCTVCETPR